MGILSKFFFQKRAAELNLLRIEQEQRMRFNPLKNFDPDKLVRAIDAFRVGDIGSLSQIIDELETRDDMMAGVARKTRASVGRCPHQVLVVEGAEGDPRAERHREVLTRFWAGIEVSSAFTRNERGGARLLKKQMMGAASRVYSVHEIVWKPLANGEISARFVQVPNWFFENRTGELRYLQSPGALNGSEMRPGEWLVTVGDGIGIAAAVLAMSKTLSRNDWLLFSERCGQPGLHVQTAAADGSPAWDKLVSAVRNFGREWSLVSDTQTKLNPVSLNVGGPLPYPPLIEMCNKGIAALYRGADLSTISGPSGDSTGASVQGDETDILEQDACEMISETLNAQVDRYVIRYVLGDDVPLAYLSIAPSDRPNVDQDIKIDNHLVSLGVRLSRNDALARYGRTEYDDTDDSDAPLAMQQQPGAAGAAAADASWLPKTQQAGTAEASADAALNGAQIQSIVSVIKEAAAGAIPVDGVRPMLKAAFPQLDDAALASIVDPLVGFKPAATEYAEPVQAIKTPSAVSSGGLSNETPSRIVAKPLQNASAGKDGKTPVQEQTPPQNANAGLLEEMAKTLSADLRPVGARVAELLDLPEGERAKAARTLAADLPSLLPEDPQMAAVMEQALAEAFAGTLEETP